MELRKKISRWGKRRYNIYNLNFMTEIDGNYLEGGGQILRTACALSAVTKKPCRVFNIRKGRPKPGLMPQHLLGVQALAELCNGRLEGDYLNSTEIKFFPGEIYKEKISIKIPTAGSITLILQTLIPPAIFAQKPIKIFFEGGGTNVPFSPTSDYFSLVFLKILEKMGGQIELEILKRGYFPAGGGKAIVKIFPSKLKSINLIERGNFKKILAISRASDFLKNKKVAERQLVGMRTVLGKLKLPIEEKVEYGQSDCPGSSLCLICQFENTILGVDGLGKLGKLAEEVGKECALKLLEEERSKGCLDSHMGDQILVYMALSKKPCQITTSKITNHCLTNIWTIEKFLEGKFEIKDNLISWLPKTISGGKWQQKSK